MYAFDECAGTVQAFGTDGGAVFVHTLRRPPARTANLTAWELMEADSGLTAGDGRGRD